jgi:hypothetical protein
MEEDPTDIQFNIEILKTRIEGLAPNNPIRLITESFIKVILNARSDGGPRSDAELIIEILNARAEGLARIEPHPNAELIIEFLKALNKVIV